jgi:hypothetical protein
VKNFGATFSILDSKTTPRKYVLIANENDNFNDTGRETRLNFMKYLLSGHNEDKTPARLVSFHEEA